VVEASEDGLADLADEGTPPQVIRASLEWGRLLHLAQPLGNRRWRLDPVVRRLLRSPEA
jgi:hypothetical protein